MLEMAETVSEAPAVGRSTSENEKLAATIAQSLGTSPGYFNIGKRLVKISPACISRKMMALTSEVSRIQLPLLPVFGHC
jgi:hypothetical protein